MEQSTQAPQAPEGKGMAVAGFVMSLVGLVLYLPVAGVVGLSALAGGGYGLGIFWLVLCLAGTGLCVMGMMKLGKTGGKKGLSIAGMVIGIVAVILSLMLVMGIAKAQKAGDMFGDKFKDAMNQGMQQMTDSLASGVKKMTDSVTTH